ncbi:MAG: undecaprenyl-diphosphate phosphatase [Rhodothalassiaceae bacterium]
MSYLHLLALALVQGITEFLPISSSAHLILVPAVADWPDQGPLIDIAVHVGTLAAVLVYFREDSRGLALSALAVVGVPAARRRVATTLYRRLFWALIVGTVPVIAAGLAIKLAGADLILRSPLVIALATLGFGLLLLVVDRLAPRRLAVERMTVTNGLIIGLAQCLALIPGTSRAGITMTAARALGFKRPDAARFSMLLAIPTILAGGALAAVELVQTGTRGLWVAAAVGALLSFGFALIAIRFLMGWLARADMSIFVVYRIIMGLGLLYLIQTGRLAA